MADLLLRWVASSKRASQPTSALVRCCRVDATSVQLRSQSEFRRCPCCAAAWRTLERTQKCQQGRALTPRHTAEGFPRRVGFSVMPQDCFGERASASIVEKVFVAA